MHRGVFYGVIAFGLAVGLCTLVYLLARGSSLTDAGKIVAMLVVVLAVRPLVPVARKSRLRGGRRATLGVALLVFALLAGAGGVIVALVGRGRWIGSAAALLAIAVAFAVAGALVLRMPGRAAAPDAMRWPADARAPE